MSPQDIQQALYAPLAPNARLGQGSQDGLDGLTLVLESKIKHIWIAISKKLQMVLARISTDSHQHAMVHALPDHTHFTKTDIAQRCPVQRIDVSLLLRLLPDETPLVLGKQIGKRRMGP